ncbi:MAG: nucleotidyltransferase domain-containing protein [Candidatus Hydrothermarchaeaceae archaeon]
MLRVRDAIETKDDLFFSVVSYHHPGDRYIAFLRYYPSPKGERMRKGKSYLKVESTEMSYDFLNSQYPHHIFYSHATDSRLQCVPMDKVKAIFYPYRRLKEICDEPRDMLERTAVEISDLFGEIPLEKKGVTGSLLLGFHKPESDVDFVFYGRKNFEKAREILAEGSSIARPLTKEEWQAAYRKRIRDASTISFDEFLRHERRKHHKAAVGRVLFDILFVRDRDEIRGKYSDLSFRRTGRFTGRLKVLDASLAFDYPAVYKVTGEDEDIREVASYTHTYVGQAEEGEEIEVSGALEEITGGDHYKRIVIGTTREALGEYIRVIK